MAFEPWQRGAILKEVEDMILHPFPEFPVTPVELQVFHVLFDVGHRAMWREE